MDDDFYGGASKCLFAGRIGPPFQSAESFGSKTKHWDELAARRIADVRSATKPQTALPHSSMSPNVSSHMTFVSSEKCLTRRQEDSIQTNHKNSTRGRMLHPAFHRPACLPLPEKTSSWEEKFLDLAFSENKVAKDSAHHIISSHPEPGTQNGVQSSYLPDKIRLYRLAPQPLSRSPQR